MAAKVSARGSVSLLRAISTLPRTIQHQTTNHVLRQELVTSITHQHYRNIHNSASLETRLIENQDERHIDIMTAVKFPLQFDTHNIVKSLVHSGMPMDQAEALVEVLTRIAQANAEYTSKTMVTKPQQDIMYEKLMSNLNSVNKDLIILEKSEFGSLRHQYEKHKLELDALKQHVKDELDKLRNGVLLDLNLEKARSKEDHAMNEKKLGDLLNIIEKNQTENEKRDTILEKEMESKIANASAEMERYRNDLYKYTAGTILSLGALLLGFYRIWKN